MSDSDEATDGFAMIYEAAAQLHAKSRAHPLLRYALWRDDEVVSRDFVAKFGKPEITPEQQRTAPAVAYMHAKYLVALQEACQDPDKEIVIKHDNSFPKDGSSLTEDDIPY